MSLWMGWCRLCAGKDNIIDLSDHRLPECYRYITKYLNIQEALEKDSPKNICEICLETLSNFNTYAIRCEKVQNMFHTLSSSEYSRYSVDNLIEYKNEFLKSADMNHLMHKTNVPNDPLMITDLPQTNISSCKKEIDKNWVELETPLSNEYFINTEIEDQPMDDESNDCDDHDNFSIARAECSSILLVNDTNASNEEKKKHKKKQRNLKKTKNFNLPTSSKTKLSNAQEDKDVSSFPKIKILSFQKTQRNGVLLICDDGFSYLRACNSNSSGTEYWVCDQKKKCSARGVSRKNRKEFQLTRNHNHPPDKLRLEMRVIQNSLKETVKKANDAAKAKQPTLMDLKRTVQQQKNIANSAHSMSQEHVNFEMSLDSPEEYVI